VPSDRFAVRVVIIVASIVALASLAAMILMGLAHQQVPDNIDRSFSTAFGALIGVIAATRTDPQPVNVVNGPDEAVPVDPAV
jgi:hypothetical protein